MLQVGHQEAEPEMGSFLRESFREEILSEKGEGTVGRGLEEESRTRRAPCSRLAFAWSMENPAVQAHHGCGSTSSSQGGPSAGVNQSVPSGCLSSLSFKVRMGCNPLTKMAPVHWGPPLEKVLLSASGTLHRQGWRWGTPGLERGTDCRTQTASTTLK